MLFENLIDAKPIDVQTKPFMVISRGIDSYVEKFKGEMEEAISALERSNNFKVGADHNKENARLVIGEIQKRLTNQNRSVARPTLITQVTNKMSRQLKQWNRVQRQSAFVKCSNSTTANCSRSPTPQLP